MAGITLYNTQKRKKQLFKPARGRQARFYSCGPTVYNYAHIGNLRTYIFADILQRVLEYNGYKVKRVMNITDVGHLTGDADEGEDKMEKEAMKSQKTPGEIAKFYTQAFLADIKELNIKKPKIIVPATKTIKEQIDIIKRLFKKGYAYETGQAVYFDVAKFKPYGRLAGQSLAEKMVAARAEVVTDKDKRQSADFALWFKLVGRYERHVMRWPSPWGEGFPGWHIECSAIATKYLGQPFDIHTGGVDHIGTHHENEIAQSQAAYGKPLAYFWLHGEFLLLDQDKMAKSSGSFITLSKLKDEGYPPLAFRYLALSSHYRSKLNFSWQSLAANVSAYKNLLQTVARLKADKAKTTDRPAAEKIAAEFLRNINDDLNTPKALAVLWDIVKSDNLSAGAKLRLIAKFDKVLGLGLLAHPPNRRVRAGLKIPAKIQALSDQRWALKKAGNYAAADKIRLELAEKGYIIEDLADHFVIRPQ